MKPAVLERWIWVLIYGGAGMVMIGLWSFDRDTELGWTLFGLGVASAALGVAGIVWRARMARVARTTRRPGDNPAQ